MTRVNFTFPHTIDGVLVAEYDASVEVEPVNWRDPEDGWRFRNFQLHGAGLEDRGKMVEALEWMRGPMREYLEREHVSALTEAVSNQCAERAAESRGPRSRRVK